MVQNMLYASPQTHTNGIRRKPVEMIHAQAKSHFQAKPIPAPMPAGQIRALGMQSKAWQRSATPFSVYTRLLTVPLLVLAIGSHAWFGAGTALAATAAVGVWLWLSPKLFPAPRSMDSWAARATMGERIWLNRLSVPIPAEDSRKGLLLSLVSAAGFVVALSGAFLTDPLLAGTGLLVGFAARFVFLSRMTVLYENMRHAHPLYRFWTVLPCNDNG